MQFPQGSRMESKNGSTVYDAAVGECKPLCRAYIAAGCFGL